MKKLIVLALLCAVVVTAGAQQLSGIKVNRIVTPVQGFDAVIDTVMKNVNSKTYFKFSAPTGYRFQHLQLMLVTPSEDSEACKLRFWTSATDSTTMNRPDASMTIGLPVEFVGGLMEAGNCDGPIVWNIPLNCVAVSVTEHADTDDFKLVGYLRKY